MEKRIDTYYYNKVLEARLRWLAQHYPELASLRSIGTSHEGRDLWLMTLTNTATGPHSNKPAFWVDGNIHATEVTGSMAALYLIYRLLTQYGQDPRITRVLDEQTFYILPRMNPDGAALALADHPRYVRSGTRPYPYEEREEGLHAEDIDGDGHIFQMRIADPTGDWKISERDPRLMIKREPDEEGGRYYRLFPEGRIESYDGYTIKMARPFEGLDFNRNFPQEWAPEGKQYGAGPFPTSEPEVRAVVAFITTHPNVGAGLTYHTYSRVLLRPYGTKSDEEFPVEDLWVFKAIGRRGTELTGYRAVSVYHDFRYHPKETIKGVFDDWMYDYLGGYAFTVELWDLPAAAGIKERKFIEWFREHPVEDDYAILAWIDEHNDGQGLISWRPFDHPQLGPVEIGGWDTMYTWRNPPPRHLLAEIEPQADFAVAFAAMLPRLRWRTVELTPLGDGLYHLLVVVENTGFLPTHISQKALEIKAVRPVRLELALSEDATLQSGQPRTEVGHLAGRQNKLSQSYFGNSPTDNRARAEWTILAPRGGTVTLSARGERAGTIEYRVDL
ncbi:MAG TPA: M14 family metallopeptidase [Ardenticatenaceae bacterium]|nr:M14 family metallopeptidase [Ardenticatenaceae bacterium]